jgi:hypothetical protein
VCSLLFFPFYLFSLSLPPGKPDNFRRVASKLGILILGELPLVEGVSSTSDEGTPYVLGDLAGIEKTNGEGGLIWREGMTAIAKSVDLALFGPLEVEET